jgi:hypothetical protein
MKTFSHISCLMSRVFYLLLFSLSMFSISSCNYPTEAKMERVSPSGKVKVNIEASRIAGIEPWRVNIKVKAYNFKEGQLSTEIMSNYLDEKTVEFNWFEESSGDIVFKQNDNTTRTFRLIANAQQMQFAEIPSR